MADIYWIGSVRAAWGAYPVWPVANEQHRPEDPWRIPWVQFTPLQEWRDAMQLLDCVPPNVEILGVGYRGISSGYYYLYT